MEKKENKVVVTSSQGYGYSYASLGDIAKQGFTLPKMKTGTEGEREYIFYYDVELKEWVRGAEIVVPESKGMNKAQLYGSALTYARRYTALLSLQLACDDDKELETKPKIFDEPIPNGNLKSLADEFRSLYPQEEQERILNGLKLKKAEEIGIVDLQKYINFKKYGKK
jgi:hypothetical protein